MSVAKSPRPGKAPFDITCKNTAQWTKTARPIVAVTLSSEIDLFHLFEKAMTIHGHYKTVGTNRTLESTQKEKKLHS